MTHRIEQLADGKATLHFGDCLDALPTLEANSIDSCVTDPPYHLSEIKTSSQSFASQLNGGCSPTQKLARSGFMNKSWDGGDIAFRPDVWREVFRVLKPGGFCVAFGGTRTYHRLACAIEDAGFEVRDCIFWVYGSGFPKSHDVSKVIDKRKDWSALPKLQKAIHVARKNRGMSQSEAARAMGLIGPGEELGGGGLMWFETGLRAPTREQWPLLKAALRIGDEFDLCFEEADREILGQYKTDMGGLGGERLGSSNGDITAPATDAAREWSGWGTALKPAVEPIVLARKPLSESTVAANVLKWGCGALNIDGCRVGLMTEAEIASSGKSTGGMFVPGGVDWKRESREPQGRWPANLVLDGSPEVVGMFPESGPASSGGVAGWQKNGYVGGKYEPIERTGYDDSGGSAARFFYCAKADADDRLGSHHPTIKPVSLMQWLVRLVTPKNGTCLDCFAGTGPTGEACIREGMRAILIEREAEYQEDIIRRMSLAMSGRDERAREGAKARYKDKPVDNGPLFG